MNWINNNWIWSRWIFSCAFQAELLKSGNAVAPGYAKEQPSVPLCDHRWRHFGINSIEHLTWLIESLTIELPSLGAVPRRQKWKTEEISIVLCRILGRWDDSRIISTIIGDNWTFSSRIFASCGSALLPCWVWHTECHVQPSNRRETNSHQGPLICIAGRPILANAALPDFNNSTWNAHEKIPLVLNNFSD